MNPGDKCSCGAPLPWHIFELVDEEDRFSHICSCGNRYVVRDGKVIQEGKEEPLRI